MYSDTEAEFIVSAGWKPSCEGFNAAGYYTPLVDASAAPGWRPTARFLAQLLQNTRESGLLAEYGSYWLYRFPLEFHRVFVLVLT